MLSKLKGYAIAVKGYAIAALGILSAVLAALWQSSRASHANDKLKGEKAAREAEANANKAMVEGLENEEKIKSNNTVDRSKFLN